jgi:peroxiredoxin
MKLRRKNQILFVNLTVVILSFMGPSSLWAVPLKNPSPVLRSGDLFPTIHLPNSLSQMEKKYLGLGEKEIFSLDEIKSDLIVVKYLNTNCPYCIKLLPVFNEIYQTLEQDPTLNGKIRIVGISTGDTLAEVEDFKRKHTVPYPILPDPEFKAHKAVGEPRVPFIVVGKRGKQGKWVVTSVHVGLIFSPENFVGELKTILKLDPESLRMK